MTDSQKKCTVVSVGHHYSSHEAGNLRTRGELPEMGAVNFELTSRESVISQFNAWTDYHGTADVLLSTSWARHFVDDQSVSGMKFFINPFES